MAASKAASTPATGALLSLVLLHAGCTMPDGAPGDEYTEAIPRASQVAINVPGVAAAADDGVAPKPLSEIGEDIDLGERLRESSGQLMGELTALTVIGRRAELYQITHDVSRAINGFVLGIVAIVREVSTWPATSRSADGASRTWGPWTEALSPVTHRLTIIRSGPGTMTFSLLGKPKRAGDAAYVEIMGGTFVGVGSGHGHGQFFIDASAAHGLDPEGNHGVGRADIQWDNSVVPRTVVLDLRDFADRAGAPTATAQYRYREATDGAGTFEFRVEGDLDRNNDPFGQKTRKEHLAVVSRWLASGAGRADMVATNGDLPWAALNAQECWDEDFRRAYYTDDRGLAPTEGDRARCVFPAP